MKKSLVSILLAALLVLSLGFNALAAGSDNNASEPSDTETVVEEETDDTADSGEESTPAQPAEENRDEAQIAEEISTLETNGTVSISGVRSIRTDELAQIAEKNGRLSVSVANASWHFNSITNPDVEFNPKMTVGGEQPEITQKMGGVEGVVVSFEHSGVLPGTAYVGIAVDYAVGTPLYFYYYNPTTAGFEYQGSTVVENGGYAVVTLTHCSNYVLTTSPLHNMAITRTAPVNVDAAPAQSHEAGKTLDVTPHTGL